MHYTIVWLSCQIKTFLDCRLGTTFPQNSQKYLECWLTSIFLICFLKLAPYLVPDPQKFAHHEKGKLRSKFILLEATFHIPLEKFEIRLQQVTCQKSTRKQTRKKPQNGNHHICQQFQLFWCVSSAMQPDRPNSSQLSDSASTAWQLHTRYVIAFETLDETGLGFNSVPLYQKAWTAEKGTNTIIERKKEWGNKTGKREKIKEQENRRVEKARRQKNVP
jgi:hypothetical protein